MLSFARISCRLSPRKTQNQAVVPLAGFQENVNSGATAALAWGFHGTARGILSSYWRYMVRDDGGVKYRGAMLPGYGRMLTILAQYMPAPLTIYYFMFLGQSCACSERSGSVLAVAAAEVRFPYA
eukprot:COSAG06_NODE_516_length_14818_cov_18.077926_3_plen_125_part_00